MSDDDTKIRFEMMELGAPPALAQGELGIAPPDDLSRARHRKAEEYASIRERLVFLEGMYAARLRHQVPTALAQAEEKHGYKCGFHPNVIVYDNTPVVKCQICGEELDPIEVLREFATGERNFAHTLQHLREEKDKLVTEVEALKRERSNIRAQIKRSTKA